MNNKYINIFKFILPIAVGIGFVYYSLSKISVSELFTYLKSANYYWILLGVFFGSMSHISRSYRWNYLLMPLGHRITFLNSFFAVFAAYLINFTIPRAGDVARATLISKYENISFDKTLGTIIAERIADLICAFVIICIALILKRDFFIELMVNLFEKSSIISFVLVPTSIGIIFLTVNILFPSVKTKIYKFFKGIISGILSITKMEHKWKFIFHTIFIWVMYVLMFYVTCLSMAEFTQISFGPVLIGFILGMFSIGATNGGIGTYPEAVVLAFSLFNLAEEPSRAFGWIMWSSQTLMILFFGAISIMLIPLYNKNRKINIS